MSFRELEGWGCNKIRRACIHKSDKVIQVNVDDDTVLVHFLEGGVLLDGIARSLSTLEGVKCHFSHFPSLPTGEIEIGVLLAVRRGEHAQIDRILLDGLSH